jgi:hypothetical protein
MRFAWAIVIALLLGARPLSAQTSNCANASTVAENQNCLAGPPTLHEVMWYSIEVARLYEWVSRSVNKERLAVLRASQVAFLGRRGACAAQAIRCWHDYYRGRILDLVALMPSAASFRAYHRLERGEHRLLLIVMGDRVDIALGTGGPIDFVAHGIERERSGFFRWRGPCWEMEHGVQPPTCSISFTPTKGDGFNVKTDGPCQAFGACMGFTSGLYLGRK